MKAQYDGPCAGDCGGRIHVGDEIEPVLGEGHRHVECGAVDRGQLTAFDAPGRTERKCKCNLIHAGECLMPDVIDAIDHALDTAGLDRSCPCACDIYMDDDHCDRPSCTSDDDDYYPPSRVGEYEIAYLQGEYERCGHCGRHWHGLPITENIARMYARGQYDHGYSAAADTSPVLCEGSTFIGPRRPTRWEQAQAGLDAAGRRMTAFALRLNDFGDIFAHWGEGWHARQRQFFGAYLATAELTTEPPHRAYGNPSRPAQPGPVVMYMDSGHRVIAYDASTWFRLPERTIDDEPWWREHFTAPLNATFGPQWWHHEIDADRRRREHARTHFPRPWNIFTPDQRAVIARWDLFTATISPSRPGYDWTAIQAALDRPTSGPSQRAITERQDAVRRPATAPHRRTAPRSRR